MNDSLARKKTAAFESVGHHPIAHVDFVRTQAKSEHSCRDWTALRFMLRSIIRNFGAHMLALGVALAERLLLVGLLLRLWGPAAYSDWASLVAAAGLLSMFELSLNVYFGNRWRLLFAEGREEEFGRLVGISIFLYALLGGVLLVCVVAVILLSNPINALGLLTLQTNDARLTLLLLAGAQTLHITRGSISQIYRGRGSFARGLVIDSIIAAVTVSGALAAALSRAEPLQLAIVVFCAQGVGGWLLMLVDLRRRYPRIHLTPRKPRAADLHHIVSNGRWLATVQVATAALLQGPVLLLGVLKFGGPALAGFVLMRTLVNFGRTFIGMMATAIGVEVSGTVAARGWSHADVSVRMAGWFMAGASGALVGGLWAFGEVLVRLWSGNTVPFDTTVLAALLLPAVIIGPALPLNAALLYANEVKIFGLGLLIQFLIASGICLLAAPRYGAVGVAFGLAMGEILAIGFGIPWLVRQKFGGDYGLHFARCTAFAGSVAAIGGLLGYLFLHLVDNMHPFAIAIAMVAWIICIPVPTLLIVTPKTHRPKIGWSVLASPSRLWLSDR